MADAIETNPRYKYVKRLADSSAERARKLHLEYQAYELRAGEARETGSGAEEAYWRQKAAAKLNDFFYWIGHANAYRGIALQVDFMETVEEDEDAEARCP